MPIDLLDTDPTDFNTTLQRLDFASKKAQLIHQIELKSRSISQANELQQVKLRQEIILLQEQIKKLEQSRDSRVT